jgi:S-adenosylmethionine:tRNA ribosyltransferase-isomerase
MKPINLKDFDYHLPDYKIAKFPAEPRDSSKLLVYNKGTVSHSQFFNLPDFLPAGSFLFFNNTKVIPARLYFQKSTGATIEIFLLEPREPTNIITLAMQHTGSVVWQCMIGNKKKWKNGEKLKLSEIYGETAKELVAECIDENANLIRFSWNDDSMRWTDILQLLGEIPLPPYFKRKPSEADKEKYQTVYAEKDGAVAAPTAGLHFTEEVFKSLANQGIGKDFLTLHVSAGTFQPVKTENALDHNMHSEQVVFSKENLENLLKYEGKIIAVGTTSLRALESLYWTLDAPVEGSGFFSIEKLKPYETPAEKQIPFAEIIRRWISYMEKHNLREIRGETEIMIVPGYEFKVCRGLITNYHLPETTLILLVAALVGEDWRKIYDVALQNDYRFLSYGDSSLLLP